MGTKEWDEHWAKILAQRLGQGKAERPEAPPPAADWTSPDAAAGAPRYEDVAAPPALEPKDRYAATDGVGTPPPLDSLGSVYGGITTGWKVPTPGALPAQDTVQEPAWSPAAAATPTAGPRGPRRPDNFVDPTGPRRPDDFVDPTGPRRPDNFVDPTGPRVGTSPELVVRELTHQISARDETRALDILRGKGGSGPGGPGLAVIVVLSAVAAFAGTYLWAVAVRDTGVLRTAESEFGAPREAEEEPECAPELAARLPEAATEPAQAAGSPAGEPEPSADRTSAGRAVAAGTSSETPPRGQAAPEVDDTSPPAPETPVRSFRAVAKPQAEGWVELGGPLFGVAPARSASRQGGTGGGER